MGLILNQKTLIFLLKLAKLKSKCSKNQFILINQIKKIIKSKFAKKLLSYMSNISKPLKQIRYFGEKTLLRI